MAGKKKDGAGGPLTARLGLSDAALRYLEALPAADRKTLSEAVLAAEQRQRERVERAIENAVHHVPLLLRGAVRRFLMGKDG